MITDNNENLRPWGRYVVLFDGDECKVKRIVVHPGKRLSLQRHRMRSEHWHFVKGEGLVTKGDEQIPVKEGDSLDIPLGTLHRILNQGRSDLVVIEVQRGDYFGEDDIERVEDDFGRA